MKKITIKERESNLNGKKLKNDQIVKKKSI
jgi:hypothetical protein